VRNDKQKKCKDADKTKGKASIILFENKSKILPKERRKRQRRK
jgi:hypothetical protein